MPTKKYVLVSTGGDFFFVCKYVTCLNCIKA